MKITKRIRKVPTVLQVEAVECAAASLSMILQYYGTYLPLERLRIECGVSRDGAKAVNIIKAAQKFGLNARGFKCEPQDLGKLSFPAIIHWNFNHFLVLEGCNSKRYYLNDPAFGRRCVTKEEFDEAFTGVIITFEKQADFKPQGRPISLLSLLKPLFCIKTMCLMLICGLALTFPGILTVLLSQVFLDKVVTENKLSFGIGIISVVLTAMFLRCFLQNIQAWTVAQMKIRLEAGIGAKTVWRLLHLPQRFFSQRYAGEIVDTAKTCHKVAVTVSRLISEIAVPIFMMIFSFVLMMFYNVNLSLLCVVMLLCDMTVLRMCIGKIGTENQKVLLENAKLIGVEMSGLEIIETLKACAMEENFFRRWSGFFSKTQNSYRKLEIFRHVLLFIPNFVSTITDLILLIFGGFLVTESVISPGVLMAFFILSSEFLSPVEHLAGLSVELQELKAALLRLGDVISYSEESPNDTPEQKEKSEISGEYSVEFQDVSFGYNLLEPPLLEKISFKLSESESIAIVGGSGCGKSTVAKLINGVFKQWNGEILIYGKSRNEYRKEELSDMIASVEQDICLFETSIFDNITLWDTSFSMSDVIKAAKDACIHDVILRRPFGYKSSVEEGGRNFSGGEIQRFEIARALVRNPKVLILDEATSALDCETERRICENIRRRGCVCIIIAHRLSTIKNCENILVLKSGKVEGIGSHELLLETCESYKELLQNLQDEETAND